MTYQLLVFIHVTGAMGLFAALGIESVALVRLRRETVPARARAWLELSSIAARIGLVSMLATVGAGIALMITVWHHQTWITAAFIAIVALGFLGGGVSSRRLRQLRASIGAENGTELSNAFRQARSSTALAAAQIVRIAIATGIVALMTAKPDAAGSALILSAAALAGAVASIPAWTLQTVAHVK